MAANVNKPVIKEKKDADVNRKLQIYGIISAFQAGKVPSNDQIDVALNSFLASKGIANPPEKLSAEGRALVNDAKEVVQQAKKLLLSKNEGNLIQDFIWQSTQFDPKSVNTPNAPKSKDAAKRDGDDALEGLRTLGTLLITNGQFRKLLQDATTLLRDITGDAAAHAADKVRPSDQDLNQMDRPAEDNTWHDKPDFSKENMKKQAQGVYGGNPKEDARDIAQGGINAANPQPADPQLAGTNAVDPRTADRAAGENAVRNIAQQKIDQNLDDETKDKVKQRNQEYQRRTKDYLAKKMPQDRKDQIIFRLKKMVLECQQHPDYMDAIQTLLRLAEDYGSHGRALTRDSQGTAQEARSGFAKAEQDLRTLIERFANSTSTEDLWDSIAQIYRDADKDPELKNWFKSVDTYIRRCLLEQGYILEDESSRAWDQLYDQGQYLLRDKYRTHTDRVVDEIKFLSDQFDQDPQNNAFAKSLQKLFNDLGNDQDGKPVFKPHLIKDLTDVIIPAILENTSYIPVPRIEYSDPQFDAVIENLILESDNFMPNVLEIANENYFRFGRKKVANKNSNTIEIKVAGIQMDLRDVSYHIKRKQGFPSITENGVADILLPGNGLSFKMKVSTADKKDGQNFFKVEKVDVDFKELKLKVIKSDHKLLFSLFKPIALKAVRPALQKAVEKAIKDQFNTFDKFLFEIKKEADRALDEARSNPEQTPNIYNRYYNAAQKRFIQGKEKVQAAVEDKKVNVAITKEESIFPNINLPGGISTKATEYKELARKGDKWESPVFSIGSAKKSDNIPVASKIQRKPHSTANPSLSGPNAPFNGAAHGGLQGGMNNSAYGTSGNNPSSYGNSSANTSSYGNTSAYDNVNQYSNGSYGNGGLNNNGGLNTKSALPAIGGGNNIPLPPAQTMHNL